MGNRVKGRPKKSSIKAALSSQAGSKRKLSRMGKVRKKHKAGLEATMFGRSKCLSMLQITLKDFRRLCILKGIYPREPMGRRAPNNKRAQTYYHIKDIRAISHEPILEKFRETRAFMKKVRRAAGRREPTEATRKHSNLPTYSLHHLVKERYPRFVDALGDIDDALTLTYLFAALPATADIKPSIVKTAKHLAAAWGAYCATANKLTKSFVSVRGVYLEARIHNTDIRWIVPHAFTQFMPETVDFRVMGTFLEFYSTLLRFVLFQLYAEMGIRYPFLQSATGSTSSVVAANLRAVTSALDASSLGQVVSASIAKETMDTEETDDTKKGASKASLELPQLPSEDEDEDDDVQDDEHMTEQLEEAFSGLPASDATNNEESTRKGLFSGFTFFFSREVPRGYLELVCLSFGAKAVGWEADDSPISMKDPSITHHIIDRPRLLPAHESLTSKREFVQPQWVLDCANQKFILPFTRYAVGSTLPPHLSPWVDSSGDGDYKPKYAEELERLKAGLPLEDEEEDEVMAEVENEDDEEAVPEAMKNDDEEESSSSSGSESESEDEEKKQAKLAKKTKKQEDEAHRLAKTMMSRKASHLYGRMQHGIAKKKAVVDTLHQKRKMMEETKIIKVQDQEIIKGKEKDDTGKTALKQKVERLKNQRKKVEVLYNDTGGSMKKGKAGGSGKKGKSKKR